MGELLIHRRVPRILVVDDNPDMVELMRELLQSRGYEVVTVRDADQIFVLDKGRVVEDGKHDVLLAQGGLYAQLYRHNLDDTEGPA